MSLIIFKGIFRTNYLHYIFELTTTIFTSIINKHINYEEFKLSFEIKMYLNACYKKSKLIYQHLILHNVYPKLVEIHFK